MGHLKVRISRDRFDFGASNQIVASVMAELEVLYLPLLWTLGLILGIAVVKAEIVVVRSDRTEHIVPDNLHADVAVVRIDHQEGPPGDETEQTSIVFVRAP